MAVNVQRSDLYVGAFIALTVVLVVAALVATSGWGVERYDVFVRTNNAQDIAIDSKIYMQGLEVGRVAGIAPRPFGTAGQLQFIIRMSLLDRFPDGTPLRLPKSSTAEVTSGLLGGSQIMLKVVTDTGGTLAPGDTIDMQRGTSPIEAFGDLARDLKGKIEQALVSATGTLDAVKTLADSLRVATGTARHFLASTQPGAERILSGVTANLDRLEAMLDSTNTRTGLTFQQFNGTLAQSHKLLASVDSLTRLLIVMGGENRPEVNRILVNFRDMSTQLGYVLEQLSRRPMRVFSGIKIPDSLSVERRRTAATDSAHPSTPSKPDSSRRPSP